MNENIIAKKKGFAFTVLFVCFASVIFFFASAYALSWGCGQTDHLTCNLLGRVYQLGILINFVFIPVFLIYCVIGQSARFFKIFLAMYTITALSLFFLSALIHAGVGLETIRNKEIACKITAGDYQGECYTSYAKATNDLMMCEKISHYSYHYNDCHQYFALKDNDASMCGAYNAFCVKQVALQMNDEKVCDMYLTGFDKDECNNGVAQKTNNPLICADINTGSVYCQDAGKKIATDPTAYISAKNIDFEIKILSSVLEEGDRDVQLIQITAGVPEGIAAVNEFFLMLEGSSIFETLPNMKVYLRGDDGSLNLISGSAAFSKADETPSYVSLYSRPIIIAAGKPKIFVIKADIKPYFKGTLRLVDVTVKTLGETQKTLKKLEGDRNIVIQ